MSIKTFTEEHTEGYNLQWKIKSILHQETSAYQEITVAETVQFGRCLILDGAMQITVQDAFIYHELMAHICLASHPHPQQVLIIGGGDGGMIKEVLKHPMVEKITLVEIDERVVALSKKYLPEFSRSLEHPKVNVVIEDGFDFIAKHKNQFDVILVDSSDPSGPAAPLFSSKFYELVEAGLKDKGIFTAQIGSPLFELEKLKTVYKRVKKLFQNTSYYMASIPTYSTGPYSLIYGSKGIDPLELRDVSYLDGQTRYYTPEIHRASFALPPFIQEVLQESTESKVLSAQSRKQI
ncbi:polyamine aminopropyltransferase [Heliorestis acidaminivorans]|uniref:Polyamine aminopropyltransferase n=1 Tax=Heliorestis acidaminivorans TaxID=553427 RepID=A0A6I0EXY8_9FIRM|nr:polyamine aminopropyltransferase [Heliorestis acidaminivorans]KAB2953271.1 polyamine aminopropyltransferase [Heliorestis acidaminivorans]